MLDDTFVIGSSTKNISVPYQYRLFGWCLLLYTSNRSMSAGDPFFRAKIVSAFLCFIQTLVFNNVNMRFYRARQKLMNKLLKFSFW